MSDPGRPEIEAAPTLLGRYRICFELASGGMATVYLARVEGEGGFQKVVAIKVVHGHLAKEKEFVEMFLDEARLAAAIDHPNVCHVFDFGEVEGRQYLAMEYLMGESLLRVAKEIATRRDQTLLSQLPWYAARIFADACEGLHAAHELRAPDGTPLEVVHRDVTPQNLVITYDGSVKVVDFGVAKAASQLHRTETGKIKGKLAYVSPEQLRNKPLDRRSDVFALGVCLWELLTLKRLFRRDSDAATLMAVAYDDIPLPSSVRSWVPPELDAIVMHALARDRDERYASARELGRDLTGFLARTGASVGMAELAEWMRGMFAADRERRLELIRRAHETTVVLPAPAELAEPSSTGSAAPSLSLEAAPVPPSARPSLAPERRRAMSFGLAGVAAIALLGLGAALPMLLGGAGTNDAATASVPLPDPSATALATVIDPDSGPSVGAGPAAEAGPSTAPDAASGADAAGSDSGVADGGPLDTGEVDAGARAVASVRGHGGRRHETESAERGTPDPPASGATGRVQVSASGGGWAEIVVDGRRAGRTPTVLTLSTGHHSIRLLPFGGEPAHVEEIDVERNDILVLRVRIEGEAP